ncbi:MAG: rhomboid family intramembrane serine protease [Planctomycetaceae bacterium]|nr:rhomboid family intramembrane serine protease [Planctomycetaceae bacterium]
MLIPWKAETPNYSGSTALGHFPWATLGVIAANVSVFFLTGCGNESGIRPFGLEYGNGLHPIQWVTHCFMHAGPMHLIGNMVFLWVFGMVVEGRLGWWKFLVAYLTLGLAEGAAEQSLTFLFTDGWGVGASGVIYGLLAMALVWAPETEIHCLWLVGGFGWMRSAGIEIAILWMAILYIGADFLSAGFGGFQLSTPLLHSVGALLGFALGVAMFKLNWVDCEGWDVFSVMSGRHLSGANPRSMVVPTVILMPESVSGGGDGDDSSETVAERFTRAQERFGKLLAKRHGTAALALYDRTVQITGKWPLPEQELLQFIELLSNERLFNEAARFLEEYLRRFESRAVPARLKLSQILIEHQQRPAYALRVLDELPDASSGDKYRKIRASLEQKARQMIDDGVLELQGRAW